MATGYDGENALELCSGSCSQSGFQQIIKESTQYGAISGFTYLRYAPPPSGVMYATTTPLRRHS